MKRSAPLNAGLLVLAGAIMLSFAGIFARLSDMPPTASGFYRMAFGTLAFAGLLLARPETRAGWRDNWAGSALIGLFFAGDIWIWHRAIEYIGPGLATLLANFQVFVLTLIGVVWMRERVGWRFALGLALAMGGLWLLFGSDWHNLPPDYRTGIVFGLLAALAYALYLLSLRGFQIRHAHIRPEARLLQSTFFCALLLGAANLAEGNSFVIPDGMALLWLVLLGLVCQMLGWLVITRGMPVLPAALVGLLLLLQPASAVLWDFLIFGLRLSWLQMGGLALALMGIYLGLRATGRNRRSGNSTAAS
ncbi:MAG TPA: DMT family transporter [Wenzhouxiangella sp.]|nr:DMT family transporter [Wenzhouxiangella sp.]